MTPDQDLADLCDVFPGWHIWPGRGPHGEPAGWHATGQVGARSVILAANGPEELRQRLRQATAKTGAPSHAEA